MPVREIPDPACPSNGAIVRVEGSGICRSDWHVWQGDWEWIGFKMPTPMILGHEFAGVVEESGREAAKPAKAEKVRKGVGGRVGHLIDPQVQGIAEE